jgi:hypothetical protein
MRHHFTVPAIAALVLLTGGSAFASASAANMCAVIEHPIGRFAQAADHSGQPARMSAHIILVNDDNGSPGALNGLPKHTGIEPVGSPALWAGDPLGSGENFGCESCKSRRSTNARRHLLDRLDPFPNRLDLEGRE